MLTIAANIKTIEDLIEQDTPASLTYAALECRLAIEQICYERLRLAHDYISHDDLSKWQPRDVVKTLIQEVDPGIVSDTTLSISKHSNEENRGKSPEEIEYLEIGTQVGFNANYLGRLWNALANLALHIPVPKTKTDNVSRYSNTAKTKLKVEECLVEFRRLSETTITLSGFGTETSFECFGCKKLNRRKLRTLKDEQTVNCIDPDCDESYKVELADGEVLFVRRKATIICGCDKPISLTYNRLGRMKLDEVVGVVCPSCSDKNYVSWRLHRAIRKVPNC